MSNRLPFLILISILLLLMDLYLFKALQSAYPKLGKKYKRSFTYIWWSYSILIILGVFLGIFFNIQLTIRSIVLVAFFITVVSKLCLLPFVLIDDFRRVFIWIKKKPRKTIQSLPVIEAQADKISRSKFLINSGVAIATIPFGSLSYGIVSGAYDYQIKRKTLYLPNLPKAFDGIKLGQLSDIHSGSFYNRKAVLGGVEMLLKEKPDFIFFTGDIVNNIASEMRDYQDIFSKVKAPLGVFSILGNHDYGDYFYGREPSAAKAKNLKEVKGIHKNLGWGLLLNEHRSLKVDNEEIAIIGIENWGAGRFAKYGRMDLATKNTHDFSTKLLLSHDPSHWRAQVLKDYPQIDMMFSGHTHGMQFGVRTKEFQWSPVQYIYKEWAGLYKEQNQQLYVNVGYGFLGYPGRIGILPEITIFELKQG